MPTPTCYFFNHQKNIKFTPSLLHKGRYFFNKANVRKEPTNFPSCKSTTYKVQTFLLQGLFLKSVIFFVCKRFYACWLSACDHTSVTYALSLLLQHVCVGICVFTRVTSALTHVRSAVLVGGDSVTVSWSTRVFLSVSALPCQHSFIQMAGVMM